MDGSTIGKAIFDGLTPEPPASYLALRMNTGSVPGGLDEELETLADRGTICASASNVPACTAAYDALRPAVRAGFHHCFTRGDEAACVEGAASALALLGRVGSIEEAIFVAQEKGYFAACTPSSVATRGKVTASGSFQLVLGKVVAAGGPCGELHRAVVEVTADGTLTELSSSLVEPDRACP